MEANLGWLIRERDTGREWRVTDSDSAWDAGGYDLTRFDLHVIDELVIRAPDSRVNVAAARNLRRRDAV